MKVYIDKNLPQHLQSKLMTVYKDNYVTSINKADVIFKYAHDSNLLLKPLEDFNLNVNTSKVKTLFFCWYNWYDPEHRKFFSKYFTPTSPKLWDSTLCQFLQLPVNKDKIISTTKKLYDAK